MTVVPPAVQEVPSMEVHEELTAGKGDGVGPVVMHGDGTIVGPAVGPAVGAEEGDAITPAAKGVAVGADVGAPTGVDVGCGVGAAPQ